MAWTAWATRSRRALRPPARMSSCADRKSTRLNSSHLVISYAVFCLKKKLNYVRFQGDFSFDETVATLANPPMQNCGLTGSYWTVTENVIPGPVPIRTARVSALCNDL